MSTVTGTPAYMSPEQILDDVALDLVASTRLEQGRIEDATDIYRDNLQTAERLGMPTLVQRCNLALCLMRADTLDDVATSLEQGRRDVEHCARAARVVYVIRLDKHMLAAKRLDDSFRFLDQARDGARGKWLVVRIERLLERSRAAVGG